MIRDGRQISRDVLEYLRMRAVALWKKGKKRQDIAEDFGVGKSAVYNWIAEYKERGLKALKRTKAPGAKPKLTHEEKKKIIKYIKNPATEYGFETPLWTCKRMQQIIKKEFNKSLDNSNVWRWLRSWGMTSQKPRRRASQRNEKEVRKWLKEIWPKIRKKAKRWQAIVYFQDECGVSLTAVLGKTWAPKGKTPVVKVTGKRGGLCVTSAISPAGRMVFRIEKKRINAELHIEFLKQIMKHHPNRKIIVIEDSAPVHTAKKVDKFVEENKKRFDLYHIPSYSPELNPDEHVWAYLKNHKLKAHQAQTKDELKPLVLSKMRGIQKKPSIIKSFFYGPLFH